MHRVGIEPATSADQLLLEEYKNAAQLTYHVDSLRDRLTVFFVAVVGIAAAGLSVVLKDEPSSLALGLVTSLFLLVAVVGLAVSRIVARLRSVQLEHFRILSKIRAYFIGDDTEVWNVVELSPASVPAPTRMSGSYMWFASIMLVAGFAAGVGGYFLVHEANEWLADSPALIVAGAFGVIWALLLDRTYMRVAQPAAPPDYTEPPIAGDIMPVTSAAATPARRRSKLRALIDAIRCASCSARGPDSDHQALADLEYRADQEREQFLLYEQRRLGIELQATAITAAGFAAAAIVVAGQHRLAALGRAVELGTGIALFGLTGCIACALIARFISWRAPTWMGRPAPRADVAVKATLAALREAGSSTPPTELRELARKHWCARATSARRLSDFKRSWLMASVSALLVPLCFLVVVGIATL